MKREFFLIFKKKKIFRPWYFMQMEIFVSYSYIAFLFSYTLFYNNHISHSLSETCRYSEFFWSQCMKIRTRETPNTDTFYAVTR